MPDYSSPFPFCFRPITTDLDSSPLASFPTSGNSNLTTCLYHTELGLFALSWCRNVIGRALHIDLHFEDHDDNPSSSFRLHIKHFFFWRKQGSKKFNLNNTRKVEIYWDLVKARYSGPEPQSGFYIAVLVNGEMTLLAGDRHREAYARTKARKPGRAQILIMRREHVFGNNLYTTKAKFGGKVRDISIDYSDGDESRLCFSVDQKRVLQINRLKWKFRGNERIEVDGIPIQISWDVYNWFFDDVDEGHAVFMFRFEKMEVEENREELNDESEIGVFPQQSYGYGMNGFERNKMKKSLSKTKSSSSSSMSSASSSCSSSVMEWANMEENELQSPSGFSLLVYAWKN